MVVGQLGRGARPWLMFGLALAMGPFCSYGGATQCTRVDLTGEVSAGQEWKAAIGHGWVFRVMPIAGGYSGWDLVVDREQGAGYPDALLLATPPWNSINEREVGTTYGLRAQDAIGWDPRSFRFLTDPAALGEGQRLFQALGGTKHAVESPVVSPEEGAAEQRLLKLAQRSSTGQFRILDARLTPGNSDAAPYAENWAIRSARTQHSNEPPAGGKPTPLGTLNWVRFSVTLWLPAGWPTPKGVLAKPAACSE